MGTRSPWSVGGGVLEFGFSSRRALFSGPGRLRNGRAPLSVYSLFLEHWQSGLQKQRLPELPNSCRGSFSAKGAPSWIALLCDRSFFDFSCS
jgi:hypothetical protein